MPLFNSDSGSIWLAKTFNDDPTRFRPGCYSWYCLIPRVSKISESPRTLKDILTIIYSTYPEIHGTCYKLPCGDQYLTVVDASSPVSTSLFFPYTDSLWTAPENLDDIYSNQRLSPEEMIEDGQPVAYVGNMSLRYTGCSNIWKAHDYYLKIFLH